MILQIVNQNDHYLEGKNKFIVLIKDELGGQIMVEFAAFKPKTNSYLIDDPDENKKAKDTKKVS